MLKVFRLKDVKVTPGHGVNMIHRAVMGEEVSAKFMDEDLFRYQHIRKESEE